MPHLDPVKRIERAYVAEQVRAATIERDRAANAERIREGIESGSAGIGGTSQTDEQRADFEDWARSKLSDDELYPDHFPDREVEDED